LGNAAELLKILSSVPVSTLINVTDILSKCREMSFDKQ